MTYEQVIARQRQEMKDGFLAHARRLRWSADRLATERESQLRGLLASSVEASPFWRERLRGVDLASFTEADLPSLPILTKSELMDNFDRILTPPSLTLQRLTQHIDTLATDSYLDDEYRILATSGSGGRHVLFAYDSAAWVTFALLATRWQGRDGQPTADGATVGTLFASNTTHVSGAFHAFFADQQPGASVAHLPATLPLPTIVDGLNHTQPTVLQGYPSAIHLLAIEALEGRLSITPASVKTCGEQCTSAARAAVRSAWGVEISDYWGTTEGVYAFPCGAGDGMHLPDDLAIIEPVDEHGRPVAPGQPAAKILLTNLYNHTQPLIRYEITDAMTLLDTPCECGCQHRRITDIRGRTDSFFIYPNGAAVHWLGMTTVLLADPNISEMQVSQTLTGAVVRVVGGDGCDIPRVTAGLVELMTRSGVDNPEVTIEQVDSLERLWSGKLRQFEPLPARASA